MACTFASSMRNRKVFLIARRRPKLKSMLFHCRRYYLSVVPTMKNASNWIPNCNLDKLSKNCPIFQIWYCNCNIRILKLVTVGNTVSTYKSFGSFLWDKKEESAWKNANSFLTISTICSSISKSWTSFRLFLPKFYYFLWKWLLCRIDDNITVK